MTQPDSPATRALRILDLVQSHPGITGQDLAKRLGVTDRAVRRSVAVLRDADISIESESGRYGGYRLGRGVRLPPLVFSTREALGLVMATLSSHDSDDENDDPARSALAKIMRALPADVSRPALLMRDHVAAAPDHRSAPPDPSITSDLVLAVADHRRVRFAYRPSSGSERQIGADPWGVVVRHGRWYLLAFAHAAGAVRTYRVDRISQVETDAETFRPPDDLDLVTVLERHLGGGREFSTTVRFEAPLDQIRPWVSPLMGDLVALDKECCLLTGTTSNPSMYAAEWLAPIPYPFTVQGGPELRNAVEVVARRMTRAIGTP